MAASLFAFWAKLGGAQQLPKQGKSRGLPCTVNQVVGNSKIKLVGSRETCMARQDHNFMLSHAILQPVCQSSPPKIVKLSASARRTFHDLLELSGEIVDDF
jgi:hypothetical protein